MDSWVSWIIQGLTMTGVGIIGYFLKRTLAQLEERITKQEQRIDQLEKEMQAFINQLPFTYTLRDDFLRTVANFDKKLDKILDILRDNKGGCA